MSVVEGIVYIISTLIFAILFAYLMTIYKKD